MCLNNATAIKIKHCITAKQYKIKEFEQISNIINITHALFDQRVHVELKQTERAGGEDEQSN